MRKMVYWLPDYITHPRPLQRRGGRHRISPPWEGIKGWVHSLRGWLAIASVMAVTIDAVAQSGGPYLYHTNRVFNPVLFTNFGPAITAFEVMSMAGQLTTVVGPTNVIVNSNNTFATEYESFAWGYPSPEAAWDAAVMNKTAFPYVHLSNTYDNVGWIKGTRSAHGTWGAYLWLLQNTVSFKTSETNVWLSPFGTTNHIVQVLVGSIGDYAAMTNVVDVGPTNWVDIVKYRGAGVSEDKVYRGDYTAYYELLLAHVRITHPPTNSLLATNIFTAVVRPSHVTATNCHFEIRRATESTWYTLTNGPIHAYTTTAAVAGNFKVRVTVDVDLDSMRTTSPERNHVVHFPSYSEITSDTNVLYAVNQAWSNTLAATTPTSRREEGFWIRVNTDVMQYEFTTTVVGPSASPTNGASVSLGARPNDIPANIAPNASATYTVASFHAHTPTTYRPAGHGRDVGPSGPDHYWDGVDDVTGLVYDYVGFPKPPAYTNSYIPHGHPLNASATLYPSGPNRRSTPP